MNLRKADPVNSSYSFELENSSTLRRNFPSKLFDVISDEANTEILQWLPGGRAFIIYDKKRFAANILPHYFKQSQFTSFTRKLSRWSFVRVNRGPLMGAYYHKLFQRDKPSLCRMMSCKGSNNEGDVDHLLSSHEEVEAPTSNEISISSGYDTRPTEDLLSLMMLKQSVREVSIAQQALDQRQARINHLLQMQRVKQACQALGIPESNVPLTQLVRAESNAIKSTDSAHRVNAYDVDAVDTDFRARTLDRARLLARARLAARAIAEVGGLPKSIAQSIPLQTTPMQPLNLQSTPMHIVAERVLSQSAIVDRCFHTAAS